MMKAWIRRWIPESFISLYHLVLAHSASRIYRQPSKRLIVIGVTGTNGKSSTVQYIGRILEACGKRVGWTTTVGFKVATREWVNDQKMTMLGRFQTQRLLAQMVSAGCEYAIIETSSQGIVQHRHVGIQYDIGVFTNLTPEHLEAHGGFEAYKQAKGKLFASIAQSEEKIINGKKIPHATIANALDPNTPYLLAFEAGKSKLFGKDVQEIQMTKDGTAFSLEEVPFTFKPIGRFNFENVLAAIATCQTLGLSLEEIASAVKRLKSVPGRLEVIDEGQPFTVIVDYGPEPVALQATYDALHLLEFKRLIHVLGSTGGGRDIARRAVLGEMAAKQADIVIVTNEDPYDDDPMQIINDVAEAAMRVGKIDGQTLWRILDREQAINKAIESATRDDLVLITGKGSEPVMAVAHGHKIPWDDRVAARKAIKRRIRSIEITR